MTHESRAVVYLFDSTICLSDRHNNLELDNILILRFVTRCLDK